jgi:hypothetical protein
MGDADHIRIAVAAARASRWIGASAALLVTSLLLSAFTGRPLPNPALLMLCLAILSGAGAIYLMVRIELDCSIFEGAAGGADASAFFASFDQSRLELGIGAAPREARPVGERVRGLLRLVRALAFLFIAELLLALASLWIARWFF